MKAIMRVLNAIAAVLEVIAIIALLVMICITLADVFLRLFFTKPITGAAVMILKERALIALDDPIERYLPELGGRRVTVRDAAGNAAGST